MEFNALQKQISLKALKVWRITGLIHSSIIWLLCIAEIILNFVFELSIWWIALGVCIAVLYTFLFVGVIPKLKWKRWSYEVREKEIELQHGVFIIKRTLVPMVRVQHVDTVQGPILRKYQLATITVSTAATIHEIPAIDMVEADQLRHSISTLARVDEEDV